MAHDAAGWVQAAPTIRRSLLHRGFAPREARLQPALVYLAGFFQLTPSIAILNVGNGTSIQPAAIFSILALAISIRARQIPRLALGWWLLAMTGIACHAGLLLALQPDSGLFLKGSLVLSLSYISILLGIQLGNSSALWHLFIRGYIHAAVLSAALAIIQFLFARFLHIYPWWIRGILNSRSFSMVSRESAETIIQMGRGFAMTPEASILFMLLLPALGLTIMRRSVYTSAILALGLVATNSLGILISLPVVALFILRDKRWIPSILLIPLLALFLLGAGRLALYSLQALSARDVSYASNPLDRLRNLQNSVSFLSRANSMVAAATMIFERPLRGWGVQSDQLQERLLSRSTDIEANKGINSMLLSLVAWFGIPLAAWLLLPCLALLRGGELSETRLFWTCTLIPNLITQSYANIYAFWIALGLAVVYVFRSQWTRRTASTSPGTPAIVYESLEPSLPR